jgi:hypothetical protein
VASNGGLNRSSGGITSTRLGLGQYRVDFGQNVSACMYQVTVGDAGSSTGDFGIGRPRRDSTDPDRVLIETVADVDGIGPDPHFDYTDVPFHIGVFC